jgi:Macrocin-O-methyltransferase (TylF)
MSVDILFDESACNTFDKLRNFPKYVRRQDIARFLCRFEIFKRQMGIKGSVVECGVHHGGGLMSWAQFSVTLEPYNYHRKIIGFDTFEGFPDVASQDGVGENAHIGAFREGYDIHAELMSSISEFDDNRFINQKQKIELVKGDANRTIPLYLSDNPHLLISLLYMDFDIYEPTVTALAALLPRVPKGGIVAFDEVNNPDWPGETLALLKSLELHHHRLECVAYEPNISFIQLE